MSLHSHAVFSPVSLRPFPDLLEVLAGDWVPFVFLSPTRSFPKVDCVAADDDEAAEGLGWIDTGFSSRHLGGLNHSRRPDMRSSLSR
jgi:hypothetical protein